jgi:hypothetical protein
LIGQAQKFELLAPLRFLIFNSYLNLLNYPSHRLQSKRSDVN